jgi:hypothetical protein
MTSDYYRCAKSIPPVLNIHKPTLVFKGGSVANKAGLNHYAVFVCYDLPVTPKERKMSQIREIEWPATARMVTQCGRT